MLLCCINYAVRLIEWQVPRRITIMAFFVRDEEGSRDEKNIGVGNTYPNGTGRCPSGRCLRNGDVHARRGERQFEGQWLPGAGGAILRHPGVEP